MKSYYPHLKQIDEEGVPIRASILPDEQISELFKKMGLDLPEQKGKTTHRMVLRPLSDYGAERHSSEQFALKICEDKITVFADTARAASYGVQTVFDMQEQDALTLGSCTDWPAMNRRGIIEGFYGNPWTLRDEEKALQRMWRNRMNTYFYSPKDDPYHRERWNELYPSEALDRLMSLLAACDRLHIDFAYMLAPGLSIQYSSASDFDALIAKYRQLYDCGVRHFGLLLDDIPERLLNEVDIKTYGNYLDAHIDLCQRLWRALKSIDSEITLTVCPTIYRGSPEQEYIVKMGHELDPEIALFWTGPKTCAHELTGSYTEEFIRSTSHRPLYWDNYPVNDAKMVVEMHLTPIDNRDPEIASLSDGIVANVMEKPEASMLSVITYAHFMWEPHEYDKWHSFDLAAGQCLGKEFAAGARILSELCDRSCITNHPNERLEALLNTETVNWEDIRNCAREYRQKLVFLRDICPNRAFVYEVAPWLTKALDLCRLLTEACEQKLPEGIRMRIDDYLMNTLEVCLFETNLLKKVLDDRQ